MTGISLAYKNNMRCRFRLAIEPALYLLACVAGLYDYINLQSVNFLLGIFIIFFCIKPSVSNYRSYRYGIAALGFALLSIALPAKTILYGATFCGICFFIENNYRKVNRLTILVAACISPIFQYGTEVFSFPARLLLTKWAAQILSVAKYNAKAEGNILLLQGNQFSVDPACMGLNMFAVSILIGISAIAIYEKRYSKILTWYGISALLLSFAFFNVIANLLRILCLALFRIPGESPMHGMAGLICLAVYGFAPSIFIAFFFIKKSKENAVCNTLAKATKHDIQQTVAQHLHFTYYIFLMQNIHDGRFG